MRLRRRDLALRYDCTNAFCGDGYTNAQAGEECDDGNALSGDGCSATCQNQLLGCGDGTTQVDEDCDVEMDTPTCDEDCTFVVCGDGHFNPFGEGCDDGNNISEDGCSENCGFESCGDQIVQPGLGEECDDGLESPDCDSDCTSCWPT